MGVHERREAQVISPVWAHEVREFRGRAVRLVSMDVTPHEDLDAGRALWREAYDASLLRDDDFETMSGIGLEPVYGPDDWPEGRVAERLGWPGRPPYTRGPHASMYRSKLWTMRLFAGFGTAEDTNVRFRELLRAGSGGLSVAFDLPTLMGRDSDDPLTEARWGAVASPWTPSPTPKTSSPASTSVR
jgi:hypothetical protein